MLTAVPCEKDPGNVRGGFTSTRRPLSCGSKHCSPWSACRRAGPGIHKPWSVTIDSFALVNDAASAQSGKDTPPEPFPALAKTRRMVARIRPPLRALRYVAR